MLDVNAPLNKLNLFRSERSSLSGERVCLWQHYRQFKYDWDSFWGDTLWGYGSRGYRRGLSAENVKILEESQSWGETAVIKSACHCHLLLPCRSCGQTRPGHDSWTAPCSRRWHCSGPGDTVPPTCRSWLAHPGIHAAPGMGASWDGRRTRPALKALILAWEYYSNQTRGTGFLDPEWQASVAIPKE